MGAAPLGPTEDSCDGIPESLMSVDTTSSTPPRPLATKRRKGPYPILALWSPERFPRENQQLSTVQLHIGGLSKS